MNLSVFWSCFYLIAAFGLAVGFCIIEKGDKKLFAGTMIPVAFISLMGYQTFVAGIINLLHIKVNIITLGLFDLCAAVVLWFFIIAKKKRQKLIFEWQDFVVWSLIFVTIIMFAIKRYGGELVINYNSIDASVHMKMARNVMDSQSVNSMYYAALHNGILMEVLGAFVGTVNLYKVYVIGDILHLALAGLMFWGVVRRYTKDNFMRVFAIIATLMYMYGYPLNSTLFGFSYLGMGVTVIAYIIAVMDYYVTSEIDRRIAVVLLAFGCFGIFQSYVLFMPVVFFSVLICFLINQLREKKLFSLNTIWTGLGIFLLATVLGLWYTYGGIFGFSGSSGGGGGTTVGSAIKIEGGIYTNLYANFIFLIPLALTGFVCLIKDKKNKLILYLAPIDAVFVLALLTKALRRDVSAYYYYKNYYVLWLLAWVLAFVGVYYLEKNARLIAVFTLGLWIFIGAMQFKNIEQRIYDKNPLLVPQRVSENLWHIYSFNYAFLQIPHYNDNKISILNYAQENLLNNDSGYIPVISEYEDYLWMQSLTGQSAGGFRCWDVEDGEDFFGKLKAEDIKYIMIYRDSQFYNDYKDEFDSLERLYENYAGYVAIIR